MINALSHKHELDPPYTRTFLRSRHALETYRQGWYWQQLDSYGDAVGSPRGPFGSRHGAQADAMRHANRRPE